MTFTSKLRKAIAIRPQHQEKKEPSPSHSTSESSSSSAGSSLSQEDNGTVVTPVTTAGSADSYFDDVHYITTEAKEKKDKPITHSMGTSQHMENSDPTPSAQDIQIHPAAPRLNTKNPVSLLTKTLTFSPKTPADLKPKKSKTFPLMRSHSPAPASDGPKSYLTPDEEAREAKKREKRRRKLDQEQKYAYTQTTKYKKQGRSAHAQSVAAHMEMLGRYEWSDEAMGESGLGWGGGVGGPGFSVGDGRSGERVRRRSEYSGVSPGGSRRGSVGEGSRESEEESDSSEESD